MDSRPRVRPVAMVLCIVAMLASSCGPPKRGAALEPERAEPDERGELRPEAPTADTLQEQVEIGAALFAQSCSGCHAGRGQAGAIGPQLIGAGALKREAPASSERDAVFNTAGDLLGWIEEHMPRDAPESLREGEYEAITAYLLYENGLYIEPAPLDSERAEAIPLH